MGLRYSDQEGSNCFFITTSFKEWFRYGDVPGVYEALEESLSFYCREYDAGILAYVLMPTHLHFVINIEGKLLSSFMRDFKKFISQKEFKRLGLIDTAIWQPRYDRVAIASRNVLTAKINYIHDNPTRANLVKSPEDWKWSSAASYLRDEESRIAIYKDW